MVPGWLATIALGVYVIERLSDFPAAIDVDFVQPVCANGQVTITFDSETAVVPLFVMVKVCAGLVVPSDWLANVNDVTFRVGTAALFVPVPFSVTVSSGRPAVVTVKCPE
jgi:hypothetical protein